jgi:hypothetical protein
MTSRLCTRVGILVVVTIRRMKGLPVDGSPDMRPSNRPHPAKHRVDVRP